MSILEIQFPPHKMIDSVSQKFVHGSFIICLILMLGLYANGYDNSIHWEVTTTAEVKQYPAIEIDGELLDFQIISDSYLLTETYTGGPIIRNRMMDCILLAISWIGLCLVLSASSFLKRYGFLFSLALFTLLINRLNLDEVGLFGIQDRLVIVIPFALLAGPLFYFHEYRPKTTFQFRFATLIIVSTALVIFGIDEPAIFIDHFASHSLYSLSIAGLLFLFIVAEENIFVILSIVTRIKGGKNNLRHFILLASIYLLNLILYYLNKSGIVPNSFSFFDPFLLLAISSIIAFWTLKYKAGYLKDYVSAEILNLLFYGLGIILFSTLGLYFFRGNDAVYESFHYFILYFHIGFGLFFFFYILINFIDPLIQGFEVFKIAYKEQHFPYVSARLGGFVVVLGFYFLSAQEPYNLLKSGYYVNLGNLEETNGNTDLADQYYQQATFLGYNTHHANYQLAWNYSDKGNEYLTKTHFEKASSRFPSPYAFVNYANLDMEINPVEVQTTLEQADRRFNLGEIKNNLGILWMQNQNWERALEYFGDAEASDTWNQAPLLNKWAVLLNLDSIDVTRRMADYFEGNPGVKSNILASTFDSSFVFDYKDFTEIPILHRQAYLLNAAPLFEDDTLSQLALSEIGMSTDGTFNDRMRKTLAIHYFKKGEVNKAFTMLDYLQANSYQHQKGGYLDDLGKMALSQGAYRLALEYFDQAKENGYMASEINRLEALAALGRADEIPDELLRILNKDPGLTQLANQLLSNLEGAKFEKKNGVDLPDDLNNLDDNTLINLASRNAFAENLVLQISSILNERRNLEAYNLILEATEINPYSVELLKMYALTALSQNLVSYAEKMLPRIEQLQEEKAYNEFLKEFQNQREIHAAEEW